MRSDSLGRGARPAEVSTRHFVWSSSRESKRWQATLRAAVKAAKAGCLAYEKPGAEAQLQTGYGFAARFLVLGR